MKKTLSLLAVVLFGLALGGCGGGGDSSAGGTTQAPTALAYSSNPALYTVGVSIANNTPSSSGGAVSAYSVSPSLPAGLSLDTGTGVISGTPTAITATASYTVTATNSGGSTTASVTITVNDVAPSSLAYSSNPADYTVGASITDNTPSSSGGTVTAYSVSPSLPVGLTLDTGTGVISGTPTAISATASYTVTATNSGGSTTASVTITVGASYTVTTSAGTGGSISPAAARVGEGETMPFTITPDTHYLIHTVSGCGGSLSGSTYTTGPVTADCTVTASFYPAPVSFTNGQAASVVIGQADFTSSVQATTQSGLTWPEGNATVVDGALYLPDYANSRILGFNTIPTTDGASADFVIGASDFTSTGSLSWPTDIAVYAGRLFALDSNSRIAVYDPLPTAATTAPLAGTPQTPAFYLTATGAGGFHSSLDGGVVGGGGKLVVTDGNNHRVLIWNSIPTADTAPDLVLGQADFTGTSANRGGAVAADTLQSPRGAWTDGERLVVMDTSNYRLLIWNSFPTSNGQAADLVLGQANFTSNSVNRGATPAANTLGFASYGVLVSGNQLFVTDSGNSRVLIWNSWPTVNGQAADNVLGQADFTASGSATTATGLNWPGGVYLHGTQLFVTDEMNSRHLIYNGSY